MAEKQSIWLNSPAPLLYSVRIMAAVRGVAADSRSDFFCTKPKRAQDLGMRTLKRFAGLSRTERVLFLKTVLLVFTIRIGLLFLPFDTLQRLVLRAGEKPGAARHSVDRIVWAVRAASRYIPRAKCLNQALAAQVLLAQSGHQSVLRIGVSKDDQRQFQAHAWVTCGKQVVIGGPDTSHYAPLLTWEREP